MSSPSTASIDTTVPFTGQMIDFGTPNFIEPSEAAAFMPVPKTPLKSRRTLSCPGAPGRIAPTPIDTVVQFTGQSIDFGTPNFIEPSEAAAFMPAPKTPMKEKMPLVCPGAPARKNSGNF